jgi:hypothetical protein
MQGMGTNGMGIGSAGMVPQTSPISALLGGGGALGPMSQYMQPNMAAMSQQHPMVSQGPQQPFVTGQQQGGQSPMSGLLAQLQGGQQGLAPQGRGAPLAAPGSGVQGLFGAVPQGGLSGVLGNLLHGYSPNGYGMFSGQPSPAMTAGGGGVS